MDSQVKLLVDRVDGGVVVVTNCSAGDVPIGTVLTFLYSETVSSATPTTFERSRDVETLAISLTIESCEIFRNAWSSIPRGFSAGIEISGIGIDAVRRRMAEKLESQQVFLAAEGLAQQTVAADRREGAAPAER